MTEMNASVKICDRVRWTSAVGDHRGEITNIDLALNANNQLVPWLTITDLNDVNVRMCGNDCHLKMMKFKVIFRDKV